MNETHFWKTISLIDLSKIPDECKAVQPLTTYLSTLDPAEIIDFYNILSRLLYKLDTREHFLAALENQADDAFLYLRCFVIGKGKQYYEEVLHDPDQIPQTFVSLEYLLSVAPDSWSAATGQTSSDFFHFVRKKYSPKRGVTLRAGAKFKALSN